MKITIKFHREATLLDVYLEEHVAEMWLYCPKTSKALSRYATIAKVTAQGVK